MKPPINSYSAPKNEKDQGKHNAWLVDQLTALERRIADLEDELAKCVKRQSDIMSNVSVFGDTTVDFGTGTSRTLHIANSSKRPQITPAGGVYLYVDDGHLMVKGTSGTVTILSDP